MDKKKVLEIAKNLSERNLECHGTYKEKTNLLDGVTLMQGSTNEQLEEFLNEHDIDIESFHFKPKGYEFLVNVTNEGIRCSKYADKKEAEEIVRKIIKYL